MKNINANPTDSVVRQREILNQFLRSIPFCKLLMLILFCFTVIAGSGQIAAWDFTGLGNYSTFSAKTFDPKLESTGGYKDITRGAGASLSTAGNSFRTQEFKNDGIDLANTDYFQIILSPVAGYEISLSTLDANFAGTPSFYASPGVISQFAYSLDGANFNLIGSPIISTSLTMPQIDLSDIAALQDVTGNITIRYYASGQTTTGGWGFFSSSSGINGLAIGGYVTPIGATTHKTDYFKSRQNGNWATADTWESSADNVTWQTATWPPSKDASAITILNTNTVTISNSVSLDQTTIDGTLELQTGGVLNINDGTGDDLSISSNGLLRITSANTYASSVNQSSGAVINIQTGGKITIGDGSSSVGSGYENFATSVMNVWNNGAIYEYNSNTAFASNNLTYFPNAGSNIPIFRVTKVNGTTGGSSATVINGILEVNSSFAFTGSASKTFRNGIRGNATLTQNSTVGNFNITSPNAILDGASLQIVLNNPLNLFSSTTVPVGAQVTITGGNVDNSSASSLLTVDGLLDMTNQRITNTNGTVILNGTYRTSHSGGFSGAGSSIPSGSVTVFPGSTIELYSLNNQDLNSRNDFANLVFSGGGRKIPGSSFSVNGTITIKHNAILDCTVHNIDGASANLVMTDNSRLITGTVSTQPGMEGVYNLTGGTIEFVNDNPTPQSIRTISSNYNNIEVSGKFVRNSSGNIKLNPGGSFTVLPTGVFTINDDAITGTDGQQTLTIQSGGIFNCGNSLGFYGTPTGITSPSVNSDIENIYLEPGSTINYSRSDPPLANGNQVITLIGSDGTVPYQNLILSGNGTKTAPAGTLEIKGNLTKAGPAAFIHNNGAVLLDGNAEQTYISGTPQIVFYNLTNNNTIGVNINDGLSVYNELLLEDNSKTNLNADITMLSDNYNTASVASIAESSVINYYAGRFIVERYIPDHSKAWQFLAAPTKGSTIRESWMEGNIAEGNANPGYGTLITSNRATWSADGFDLFSPGGPSMKTFDPISSSWKGITSTSSTIDNQNGYMLFVRGDRSAYYGDPETVTIMRTRGKLYTPGTEAPTPVSVPSNSFQSIANPYASAVDFSKIRTLSPGINNAYYIWDPQLTTSPSAYGLGAYRTISGNFSVPSSGNYMDGNIPFIQSGQAFFVRNETASACTVNFDESVKVNGSSNIFREGNIKHPQAQLRLNLFAIYENQPVLVDGALTLFHESYSNKVDALDALKLANSGENIGILNNNQIFAIERRSMTREYDTLFYNLRGMKYKTYQLELIGDGFDQYGVKAFLKDDYLNTTTQIQPIDSTIITFDISSDSASKAKNRFSVILAPANPLPVSLFQIDAFVNHNEIIIKWEMENENNLLQYEPERSKDGLHFNGIGIVSALNHAAASYIFTDHLPDKGYNYYRIRSIGKDKAINYSRVVKAYYKNATPDISIYPNPVENDVIYLHFSNVPTGKYKMSLLNSSGHLLLYKEVNHKNENDQKILQFNREWPSGVYHLEIIKPDGMKTILNVSK
jgi:hypothetical protein